MSQSYEYTRIRDTTHKLFENSIFKTAYRSYPLVPGEVARWDLGKDYPEMEGKYIWPNDKLFVLDFPLPSKEPFADTLDRLNNFEKGVLALAYSWLNPSDNQIRGGLTENQIENSLYVWYCYEYILHDVPRFILYFASVVLSEDRRHYITSRFPDPFEKIREPIKLPKPKINGLNINIPWTPLPKSK